MMTLRKRKAAVAVLAAVVFWTGVTVPLNDARGQNAAVGATGADLRQKARARVKPAEDVVTLLEQRVQGIEPLTPSFVQLQARWRRRLAEARIDATDDSAARVRAAEQCVQQSRAMLAILDERRKAGADVTFVEVSQGTYEVADAEYLLATTQGR